MKPEEKSPEEKTPEGPNVVITPPKMMTATFKLSGTAPLVVCKFSKKARDMMAAKQKLGDQPKKGKAKRAAKDFDEVYEGARHISAEGWDGIHAGAFRAAMIDACRLVNYKMILAKMGIFAVADGFDVDEHVPLVKIIGKPERFEAMGRSTGVPDIRIRPMYWPWKMVVRIRYDSDMFGLSDITNLLMRVGVQVGIGEGRPLSKNSAGMGWGTFDIE